jgi:GDP-L-fucose synthase
MEKESKIYVAGDSGMVGSAIARELRRQGYTNLVGRTLEELDLTDQRAVSDFMKSEKPEFVIDAAAKVGGIVANNTYPARFIYENLMIQNNLIHHSYLNGVKKLLFLGSSCIYPRNCPQPMREADLLTGLLEPTNEAYAIAKISGIKMCEFYAVEYGCNFIAAMPTNLYGPNDNFDLVGSHVLPGMMRKMYLAKCLENKDLEGIRKDLDKRPVRGIRESLSDNELIASMAQFGIRADTGQGQHVTLTLWGSGNVLREFLYVDDLAKGCVYLMHHFDSPDLRRTSGPRDPCFLNIGSGVEHTIRELAEMIKQTTGFKGTIAWDHTNPDGTPRKLMDSSKIMNLGWKPEVGIGRGIREFYEWYSMNDK